MIQTVKAQTEQTPSSGNGYKTGGALTAHVTPPQDEAMNMTVGCSPFTLISLSVLARDVQLQASMYTQDTVYFRQSRH